MAQNDVLGHLKIEMTKMNKNPDYKAELSYIFKTLLERGHITKEEYCSCLDVIRIRYH